jgi:acetyl-CoA C-acetyltransferase
VSPATYVLGGWQSDFARAWSRDGLDISDITRETTLHTLESCALEPEAIQSIHVGNAFGELHRAQGHLGSMVAQVVPELSGVPAMRHEGACASGSLAILAAMAEIEAGRYDCALVLGVEEQRNVPGDEASRIQNSASWQGHEGLECRFMWPAAFGRIADEYAQRYGLDRAHLNHIAKVNYANARDNPNAQTRKWQFTDAHFTDDDATNPVIEPGTRRQDCAQITDGGCGVVLASARFAAEHARARGIGLDTLPRIAGWGHRNAGLKLRDKLARSRGDAFVFPHLRQAILDAWRRAGVGGIDEIDGIETHDCFTITEYLAIDHFGITPPGQSWRAIEDGTIEHRGALPVNPSGGLIGVGHPVGATGVRMLLDAAHQVTGAAGEMQVDKARRFATLNVGGSCATVVSFVVEV